MNLGSFPPYDSFVPTLYVNKGGLYGMLSNHDGKYRKVRFLVA